MSSWMFLVIAFVAVDILVTVLVIRHVLLKRAAMEAGGEPGSSGITNVTALLRFGQEIHPRLGEIVRLHWSGNETSLPSVLAMAMEEADREARARGLNLDRDVLRKVVETSIAKHGVAKSGAIREALKQVA